MEKSHVINQDYGDYQKNKKRNEVFLYSLLGIVCLILSFFLKSLIIAGMGILILLGVFYAVKKR